MTASVDSSIWQFPSSEAYRELRPYLQQIALSVPEDLDSSLPVAVSMEGAGRYCIAAGRDDGSGTHEFRMSIAISENGMKVTKMSRSLERFGCPAD